MIPIVAGGRLCDGSESNILACPEGGWAFDDQGCEKGCLGPDGIQGTEDDSPSSQCTHSIDQGAICHHEDSPSNLALTTARGMCRGCGFGEASCTDSGNQAVHFSCIEFCELLPVLTACKACFSNKSHHCRLRRVHVRRDRLGGGHRHGRGPRLLCRGHARIRAVRRRGGRGARLLPRLAGHGRAALEPRRLHERRDHRRKRTRLSLCLTALAVSLTQSNVCVFRSASTSASHSR